MTLENYAADLPESLQWADDLLTRFGRWSQSRGGKATCGSAEGMYRGPAKDDDMRRAPMPVGLTSEEAVNVNRALAAVPDQERVILRVLYIVRSPVGLQLRVLRVPPKLCRERHATGVRMFANNYRVL